MPDIIKILNNKVFSALLDSGNIGKSILYQYRRLTWNDCISNVYIETTNVCNRSCGYCPVSKNRKPKNMLSTELYHKVIDELADMDFRGTLYPVGFGEPLLDDRILELTKYTRKKLPECTLFMFTNGDLLTRDFFDKLMDAGVSKIRVSLHEPLKKREIISMHIEYLQFYDDSQALTNRAGNVNVPKNRMVRAKVCPFLNSITIDSYGDVHACCNDYLSEVKYGNIERESLNEIWMKQNFVYDRFRRMSGFFDPEICQKCMK